MRLVEKPVPPKFRRQMFDLGGMNHAASFRMFETPDGEIRAHLTRSQSGFLPDGRPDLRWHISVSIKDQKRLPSWEELKDVRAALKPEVFFVLSMPPERYWMNYAEVLHLSEVKDANMIEQCKYEGMQARADAAGGVGYGATLDDVQRGRRR